MRFDENLRNKGLTEAFRTSSLIRQKNIYDRDLYVTIWISECSGERC